MDCKQAGLNREIYLKVLPKQRVKNYPQIADVKKITSVFEFESHVYCR